MDPLIRSISVVDLFGLYSFDIPSGGKGLQEAAILYGDNGLGKSTVLRLVFHLLSAADKRGHRTALSKVPFRSLEVELGSGIVLRAQRRSTRPIDAPELNLTIHRARRILAEWLFVPGSSQLAEGMLELDEDVSSVSGSKGVKVRRMSDGRYLVEMATQADAVRRTHPRGEAAYIEQLARHVPTVFLLNAERRLDGDAVPDPSDEIELRRALRMEEPKRINDLVVRSREIALTQALNNASRWISRQAIQGANRGSTNVHSVYVNVLKHLATPSQKAAEEKDEADPSSLLDRISRIEARSAELARYELTPPLPTADFRRALQSRAKTKKAIAVGLLRPYVESIEGRLSALDSVYRELDSFVSIVNGFLNDKSISYAFSTGFRIRNRLGADLGAGQLSSGEQQLLLLFCYVLVSRDKPSVFIIDEPEISLNVKWQRRLVHSLLEITKEARIQYIFASHSIELIAQHRGRVVKLESSDVNG